ncbi:MAG: tRNA pseudouridine(55) synthase TruB [Bacteroidota bacterium]|nr:tRNA pseudouridine(55) synthase TruB [Bacteroidota bacterium]
MFFSEKNYKLENILDGEVILINKPYRWSSFDVVKKIRSKLCRDFNLKKIKVGHAGTLDPLATGLLLICTGKQTKNISSYQDMKKTYEGKFKIGETTPSFDLETEVNEIFDYKHIEMEKLIENSKKFIGKISQKPPIFSALKKDGKRLYQYARENEIIELKDRQIRVYDFQIKKYDKPYVEFMIECSKGTYIRSIANDYGKSLKSGAFLYSLKRTNIGKYSLKNALEIS